MNERQIQTEAQEPQSTDTYQFEGLGLSAEILQAVADLGFQTATEIQYKSIPCILQGKDVIGRSQTGTGKTAAFGIPAVEMVDTASRQVQVLILCPTRELAMQSYEEIMKFSKYKKGLRAAAVYGGQQIERQFASLKRGVQIVIGTPGRIMDHMRRGTLKLSELQMIVLDEADEMLNMGFREDIETILKDIPSPRQTVLFSATMPPAIMNITRQYQNEPVIIEVNRKQRTLDTIEQYYYEIPLGRKMDALGILLYYYRPSLSIVFCNTKKMVEDLTGYLNGCGFKAAGLHGDMKQAARTRVMENFKNHKCKILIATDVAARGIDVENVDAVFNYDLPQNPEYYIHRIGRTGRAGKNGAAYTLVSGKRQFFDIRLLQKEVKCNILLQKLPTAAMLDEKKNEKYTSKMLKVLQGNEFAKGGVIAELLLSHGYGYEQIAKAALTLLAGKESKYKIVPVEIKKTAGIREKELAPFREKRKKEAIAKIVINCGRQNNLSPNHIVGALTDRAGLAGRQIGKIQIGEKSTVVEIPSDQMELIISRMDGGKINGRQISVQSAPEQVRKNSKLRRPPATRQTSAVQGHRKIDAKNFERHQ